ncbi:3126_t:CDS:2, partial [Dentiscutata heterogama]
MNTEQPEVTEIDWRHKINKYKNIFKKSTDNFNMLKEKHLVEYLGKDNKIAAFVGAEPQLIFNQECDTLDYGIQEKLKSQQYKTNIQKRKRSASPIEKKREIKKTCKKEEDIVKVFNTSKVHNIELWPVKSTN